MPSGTFSSYDLTVGTKLSVEDMIALLDPHDAPLHGMFDLDGRPSIRKGTATQKKEEWLDDTLQNPRDFTSASAVTAATEIVVTDRLKFTTDDILLTPAQEYLRVTGYSATTANTLLVSRGFGGSTAASIASGADIVGVGTALPEGSDPNDGRFTDRSNRFNFTQIFGPYKLKVSGTEQVLDKYGLRSTEMDYQIAKHIKQAAVTMEQAILYGTRTNDDSTKRRTMGGFSHYIQTNVDSTTTDLTEIKLKNQLQAIYDKGGRAEWAVAGSTQKGKISAFNAAVTVNVDRGDRTRGSVVDYFESDFATVAVMMDRWVRKSDLFLFDGDQAEERTLVGRELQFERLGKTGDSEQGQLVCEKTLVFRRQSHAARFSALQ